MYEDAFILEAIGCIGIDMNKARDIQRERIREERIPLLEVLDMDAIKSLELPTAAKRNKEMARITRLKNILRDAPNSNLIDEAKDDVALSKITCHYLIQNK